MLKRICSGLISALLVAVLLLVVTTKNAYAYIDIASGSYLLQMLVAVGVSSLFAIKIFWQRISSKAYSFFTRIKRSNSEIESELD